MNNLCYYQLPVLGRCGIEEEDGQIRRLLLGAEADGREQGSESALLRRAAEQLGQYLRGERRRFDLPLAPEGTAFQQKVWAALEQVEWGSSCSYGELAAAVGCPGGARAVGGAVGANPIPILIPCHRVLAAGGRLGGFRLGAELKCRLLELEGHAF